MSVAAVVVAGVVGALVGSGLNRLIVREPGYVITDPGDLPEGADPALLDELEPAPELSERVPVLALVRPHTWWRRWFPVTEVVTGALFALTVQRLDDWAIVAVLFLVGALVALGGIDLRVYRIPDRINFPAMGIGFALIAAVSVIEEVPEAIVAAAFGGFAYATLLFLAHIAYPRGMGWGDVKLAWLMGFFVGWAGWTDGSWTDQLLGAFRFVLSAVALGSLLGAVMGAGYALIRRSMRVVFPYGPSLAIGCLVVVLWAGELR